MKAVSRYLVMILSAVMLFPARLFAQNDAAGLFKSQCALCHGENGSGNSPSGKALKARDLRSPETQNKTDAELADVIAKGRNKMPRFGQKLKSDQIQQLVTYIRHLAGK